MSGRSWQLVPRNPVHTGKLFSLFTGPDVVLCLLGPLANCLGFFLEFRKISVSTICLEVSSFDGKKGF